MTGKEFKIELIKAGLNQNDIALAFSVNIKTINTICNKVTVPKLYSFAIHGYIATINDL